MVPTTGILGQDAFLCHGCGWSARVLYRIVHRGLVKVGDVILGFTRNKTDIWHREVPGARWFKADLHVHTIDDLPGGRAKVPPGLPGPAASEEAVTAYARSFLKQAIEHNVRVIAVTPHSPRIDDGISAAWRIVEEWNAGDDDDGIPFRDKIYAVFPGFEPSVNNGKSGLHLLFIFDPEIGRDDYFRAFDLVMGGVAPWHNRKLQLSSKNAATVFEELRAGVLSRERRLHG